MNADTPENWDLVKRRIAYLTGTELDANGELDEDAITPEQWKRAMELCLISVTEAAYAEEEEAETVSKHATGVRRADQNLIPRET